MSPQPTFRPEQAYATPPNSQPDDQRSIPNPQPSEPPKPYFSPTPTTASNPFQASAPPPSNNEIIFPTLPLKPKNLKSPLFIPAVLRPTERPPRNSPLTPPRSMQGSTDSLDRSIIVSSEPIRPTSRHSMHSFRNRTTNTPQNRRHYRHLSTSTIASTSTSTTATAIPPMDNSDLPPCTAPPTHSHWKPDSDATICDAPICRRAFSLFERRHHCRHCGHIFCNTHSGYTVPLDQNADFHPTGTWSRACEYCWGKYRGWVEARMMGLDDTGMGVDGFEEGMGAAVKIPSSGGSRERDGRGQMAGSVPDAFQFSTF